MYIDLRYLFWEMISFVWVCEKKQKRRLISNPTNRVEVEWLACACTLSAVRAYSGLRSRSCNEHTANGQEANEHFNSLFHCSLFLLIHSTVDDLWKMCAEKSFALLHNFWLCSSTDTCEEARVCLQMGECVLKFLHLNSISHFDTQNVYV